MYIYRLKEITPFVIGVKSYGIYIYYRQILRRELLA